MQTTHKNSPKSSIVDLMLESLETQEPGGNATCLSTPHHKKQKQPQKRTPRLQHKPCTPSKKSVHWTDSFLQHPQPNINPTKQNTTQTTHSQPIPTMLPQTYSNLSALLSLNQNQQ